MMRIAPTLLLCMAATALRAQPAARADGAERVGITGTVLDAGTGRPISGALLTLRGVDTAATAAVRTARTNADGRYLLAGVTPGDHRLVVRALGYRPATVGLSLASPVHAELSVALQVRPIELRAVTVNAELADAFGRPAPVAPADDDTRLAAERERRRRFLASDARTLTAADVAEAVTVAEPDLFRAMQRLPGVATRDDYTAELWTRGAPWSQTAVRFDGVPLFNPLHAAGGVSAVSVEQLGGVRFHPGAQPVDAGGGAAGRLDLVSRGDSPATLDATAELSLLSGRLSAARAFAGGRGAWAVGARRSHLDLASRLAAALRDDSTRALPYAFGDMMGRAHYALGSGRSVEASGLVARDALRGPLRGVVEGGTARWASGAARVSFRSPLRDGTARVTLGGSRLALRAVSDGTVRRLGAARDSATLAEMLDSARNAIDESVYVVQPMRNAIAALFGEVAWSGLAAEDGVPAMHVGARVTALQARYRTTGDWPRQLPIDDTLSGAGRAWIASAWVDRRWRVARLELETGARAEAGTPAPFAGGVRLAPRLGARYTLAPSVSLSASGSRTYQYAQTLTAVGPGRDAIATASMFWMVADSGVPAVRADLLTLGAEWWPSERTVAAATLYRRHASGVLTAAPPDENGEIGAGPYAGARQRARGLELSLRRLAGRVTGSAAYAWQRSELEARGVRFPAPWERRHLLQLTAAARVTPSLGVGIALAHTAGAPFTPFYDGQVQCQGQRPPCVWVVRPGAGAPSSQRLSGYQALDLTTDWTRPWGAGRRVTAYAQVKNVLDRRNPATYLGSGIRPASGCVAGGGHAVGCAANGHEVLKGLRALPTLGMRVTF